MFSLNSFKIFARISGTDEDSLILELSETAQDVIQGSLGLPKVTPAKATALIRLYRAQGNTDNITIPKDKKFTIDSLGISFLADSETAWASDKAEIDIMATAEKTGEQYNTSVHSLNFTPITGLDRASLVYSISGLSRFSNIPDNQRTTLAVFFLCLNLYEGRGFLREDNQKAVMKIVNALISRDRINKNFTGGVQDET